MQLNEETIGHTTILSPQDDLDITTLPAFEARLSRLINGGTRNLIWELSDVPFLPSTAAGFLLQTARRMRDAGGRCVLVGGSRRVAGTLRTMGILDLLPTFPDRATALAQLEG